MAKSPAWQRKEGKNPKGGLNAKGRASHSRDFSDTPSSSKLLSIFKKRDLPNIGLFGLHG